MPKAGTSMKKAFEEANKLRELIIGALSTSASPMTGRELADMAGIRSMIGATPAGYGRLSTQLQQMRKKKQIERIGGGIHSTYCLPQPADKKASEQKLAPVEPAEPAIEPAAPAIVDAITPPLELALELERGAPELPTDGVFEGLLDRLAVHFADRIATKIHDALKQRAIMLLQNVVNEVTHDDVQKKRSVLLVGPKSDQAAMLEREFSKLLDLRIIDKDHLSRAHAASKTVNYVLLWTDFIPHAIQNTMPREKVIFVRGGMDAVRAKLEEIYCI